MRYTDPSGHCEETGDEACWGIYEQIIQECPECADLSRPAPLGDRTLDQEGIYYLKHIRYRIQHDGWRPSPPNPFVVGTSASGGLLGHNVIGEEKLTNPKSGDITYFLFYGLGGGLGGGGSISRYAGEVKNLDDNMEYSGNFVSVYDSAVEGVGGTSAYSFVLGDNPINPQKPNVHSAGLAAGAQLEMGMTITEYVPILTIDKNGNKTWNIDDYLFDPEFKYRGIGGKVFFNAYGHSMTEIWRRFGGN